jgi:hypothetical protein
MYLILSAPADMQLTSTVAGWQCLPAATVPAITAYTSEFLQQSTVVPADGVSVVSCFPSLLLFDLVW